MYMYMYIYICVLVLLYIYICVLILHSYICPHTIFVLILLLLLLQVLAKASRWIGVANRSGIDFTAPSSDDPRQEMATLMEDGGEGGRTKQLSMLGHLAGCIPTANISDFKMTLFRATRGNMHLQHEEIDTRDLPEGSVCISCIYTHTLWTIDHTQHESTHHTYKQLHTSSIFWRAAALSLSSCS